MGNKAITPTEKPVLVQELFRHQVKPVRACCWVGLPQWSWHDRPKPRQDSELRGRIREIAGQHPRRGFRFMHVLLVKEGQKINRKRVRRFWGEEELTVKKKPSRKVRTGNTIPMTAERD